VANLSLNRYTPRSDRVAGETVLSKLLASLALHLMYGDFVVCTIQGAKYADFAELLPIASFREAEGWLLEKRSRILSSFFITHTSIYDLIRLPDHTL
jgi:hypothetical protein